MSIRMPEEPHPIREPPDIERIRITGRRGHSINGYDRAVPIGTPEQAGITHRAVWRFGKEATPNRPHPPWPESKPGVFYRRMFLAHSPETPGQCNRDCVAAIPTPTPRDRVSTTVYKNSHRASPCARVGPTVPLSFLPPCRDNPKRRLGSDRHREVWPSTQRLFNQPAIDIDNID